MCSSHKGRGASAWLGEGTRSHSSCCCWRGREEQMYSLQCQQAQAWLWDENTQTRRIIASPVIRMGIKLYSREGAVSNLYYRYVNFQQTIGSKQYAIYNEMIIVTCQKNKKYFCFMWRRRVDGTETEKHTIHQHLELGRFLIHIVGVLQSLYLYEALHYFTLTYYRCNTEIDHHIWIDMMKDGNQLPFTGVYLIRNTFC